jgi:hypothetical protein
MKIYKYTQKNALIPKIIFFFHMSITVTQKTAFKMRGGDEQVRLIPIAIS